MTYLSRLSSLLLFVFIGYLSDGCIESYSPPEVNQAQNYLVVEGTLNPSITSEIRLSRTQKVKQTGATLLEQRAQVKVESDRGNSYNLVETQPGVYTLKAFSAAESEKFRLHIQTIGGKEYLSTYVPLIQTPAIDSVTYRVNRDRTNVQIFVNTHDPLNKTRFYRWNFEETWEYQAPLYSGYEIVAGKVRPRTEDINTCWGSQKSAQITLANTLRLSQDVVQDVPLTTVLSISGKLARRYSILVRQYGLSREEFDYWAALSKTNEITGSLFDGQPSQITGNITSVTSPEEPVFGFFSASTPQFKRLFITEYLGRFTVQDQLCEPLDTLSEPEVIRKSVNNSFLILIEHPVPGSPIPFYTIGSIPCSDCRTQGGTNKRPVYW